MMVRWSRLLVLVLGSVALASPASAQAPAAVEEHAQTVATRHTEDDVRLALTAGSALTYGNARNLAVNLGADFILRLDQHALGASIGWIYGLASTRDPATNVFSGWGENANNLTWKLRYDFFMSDDDALFVVHYGRRDPFAQLQPRIGFQAGYMRNFVSEDKHRFWGEIGYDFTYDAFGDPLQVGVDDMNMPVLSTDRVLHSLRLFIGYDNRLNEVLTFTTGLQALMRLDRPEHWRFEWINQLRSKLADWLQISLDVTARLDSLPPGQAEAWNEQSGQPTQMFDLITTLNLVGTFDMYSEPVEEEEEEPECEPCPACEEAASGSESESATDSASGTESGSGSESESATEPATDSASEPASGTEPAPESEPALETAPESETASETEAAAAPEAAPEPAAEEPAAVE